MGRDGSLFNLNESNDTMQKLNKNELTDIQIQLIRDDESTLDTLLNCGNIADVFPDECRQMLEILKPITDWLIEEGV